MIVIKPWGSYEVFEVGSTYDKKILKVNPGFFLSLQFHGTTQHPGHSEQWVALTDIVVVKGFELDKLEIKKYQKNDTIKIAAGEYHALVNPFSFEIAVEETRTSPIVESAEDREKNITRIYDQTHRYGLPDFPEELKAQIKHEAGVY